MGQEPSTRTDQNSQLELEPQLESSFPSLASLAPGFYPLGVGEGIGRSSGVTGEIQPPAGSRNGRLSHDRAESW